MKYQLLPSQNIFNKINIATVYSAIAFCVISYLSVMYSLLQSVGRLTKKPVTNLGFPYKYYYQFWLKGNDSPNCGWRLNNFILDCFITWLVVLIIHLIVKHKKGKTGYQKSYYL